MTRRDYLRASFFLALTDLFPPLVKDAILADDKVTGSFSLTSDGIVTFGPANTSFLRSKVFSAIRKTLAAESQPQSVDDQAGTPWVVHYKDQPMPHISLRSDAGILTAAHFGLLADDRAVRRSVFDAEVRRVNLPGSAVAHWDAILQERALTDDEMGEFVGDINMTPVVVSSAIAEHLARANVSIDVLVPKSLVYYERLVGQESGQVDIRTYVNEVMGAHMSALIHWKPVEGLQHCLLLGAHSLVAQTLSNLDVDAQAIVKLAGWVAEKADPISKGLFLELCLLKDVDDAAVSPALINIAGSLGMDGEAGEFTPYTILSTVLVAVYGELAQTRLMASKPIYWRRLAAFAQASLIVRHVLASQLKLAGFIDWLRGLRSNIYVAQVYVDLREAPLWQPQFALPYQLRNEIGGRVVMQAGNSPEVVAKLGLTESLVADTPESLKGKINLILAQMPGPLEGDIRLVREIPPEQYPKIEDPLNARQATALSYVPLVNSALLFAIPSELADLAAEALRRAQFQIGTNGDNSVFSGCLAGLATTASATRSQPLADALFSSLRYYRRFSPDQLSVDEALRVGMIACASRPEFNEWCLTVGRLISDLSFQAISEEEAAGLHTFVLNLCGIVPELWATCGPGLAALEAAAA